MTSELPFGKSKRTILSGLTAEPDPLGEVEYSGDLQTDSLTEISALESAFKERRKQEDRRFRDATDSEYWFAVCFRNRADKDRFLQAVGRMAGDKYLSGYELAQQLEIEV